MRFQVWIVVIVLVGYVVVQMVRPVPAPQIQTTVASTYRVPGSLSSLPWPSAGQAAIGVDGMGVIATHGAQTPQPIASLTKLMTAYLVLKAHPIASGTNGPNITFNASDVARYVSDKNGGQSVVQVFPGEVMTERQALEALLIPSGNNIAYKLAQWVSGTQANFVVQMNATAKKMGMTQTHYVDASGVNYGSVSTAVDELKIAEADMAINTFRHIVRMPQVNLPGIPVQYNDNYELGTAGIIGVKTGSTNHAGGCYVYAAYRTVGGHKVLVMGAILGQQTPPILITALHAGVALLNGTSSILSTTTIGFANKPVAEVTAPWTKPVLANASGSLTVVSWPGMMVHYRVVTSPLPKTISAGTRIGTLLVSVNGSHGAFPIRTVTGLPAPSTNWKLSRI